LQKDRLELVFTISDYTMQTQMNGKGKIYKNFTKKCRLLGLNLTGNQDILCG